MWVLMLCGLLVALFAWRLCQQAGEQGHARSGSLSPLEAGACMNQKQIMLQRFQRLQHSTEERASPAMPEKQGQAVKRTYQRKQILHENMNSAAKRA